MTDEADIVKKLEHKIKLLEYIISNSPGHLYWKDLDGIYLGCNTEQARTAGYDSEKEVVGLTDYDLPWKNQADKICKIDQEVISLGKTKIVEEAARMPDGTIKFYLSTKKPLRIPGTNEIHGIVGNSLDITAQKEAQELAKQKERNYILQILGASIAHELRTPLAATRFGIESLIKYLPEFIDCYKKYHDTESSDAKISNKKLEELRCLPNTLKKSVDSSFNIIDMFMVKIKHSQTDYNEKLTNIQDIAAIIQEALNDYPFSEIEKKLVHFDQINNFKVRGNDILIRHLIFNLLKNAIYFIHDARKGEIFIRMEQGKEYNLLIFEDTAKGISADFLPKIFDQFTGQRFGSTGLGLSFCKLTMEKYFDGKINCYSENGKYTKFVMSFPRIDENEQNQINTK